MSRSAHICSLTMADSGPAWSSKSSRSSPMISASKSWLGSRIGPGLLVRHPFTYVSTESGTDVGADTARGTDSKPGGSDRVTDKMLLLWESSSTTESFRGECTATGGWIGAGAKTLLSWLNWGTSKTQKNKMRDSRCASLRGANQSFLRLKPTDFYIFNWSWAMRKLEIKNHHTSIILTFNTLCCVGNVAYFVTWRILITWSPHSIQGRLFRKE